MKQIYGSFFTGRAAFGWLIVRVVYGLGLALHGYQKFVNGGPFHWGDQLGIPPFWQSMAFCAEFAGGIAMILGLVDAACRAGHCRHDGYRPHQISSSERLGLRSHSRRPGLRGCRAQSRLRRRRALSWAGRAVAGRTIFPATLAKQSLRTLIFMELIGGLHRFTTSTSRVAESHAFYTGALGMPLVKKTVRTALEAWSQRFGTSVESGSDGSTSLPVTDPEGQRLRLAPLRIAGPIR